MITWSPMSPDRYAAFSAAQGEKLVNVKGTWWRQVRPLFYRPLLLTHEYSPASVAAPRLAALGGYQHCLPKNSPANSTFEFLLFQNPQTYSLEQLSADKRRQVRAAEKVFELRPIVSMSEFSGAYDVYLDFYQRTGYSYRSDRRVPGNFADWARTLLTFPEVLVLGAYASDRLCAISVSQLVDGVLLYSTVFCDTAGLKQHVNSLILHNIRCAASRASGLHTIFAGNRKHGAAGSVDAFYLLRGCCVVTVPALLKVNPLAAWGLRTFRTSLYASLVGAESKPGDESPTDSPVVEPSQTTARRF